MSERRALWVATSTQTRGGIASYVRAMQQTPMWTDWNVRHVVTHGDGSTAAKIGTFARGAVLFVIELIRFRPHVVHLHASARGSFVRKAALFWISRPARVPVVMHMHGSAFPEFYATSPRAFRAVIRATLRGTSAFVALGEVWSDRIREIAPTARIIAIPNAIRVVPRVPQPEPGEPVAAEVLVRWTSPALGQLSPSTFIPSMYSACRDSPQEMTAPVTTSKTHARSIPRPYTAPTVRPTV